MQNTASDWIMLVEDEVPDRGDVSIFLQNEIQTHQIRTVPSMENLVNYLIETPKNEAPPAVIILDLFIYSRRKGDTPEVVLDQLMVKVFETVISKRNTDNNTEPIRKEKRLVAGRIGVLSNLVDIVLDIETMKRPKLVLFTQVREYFQSYNRAYGYIVYGVTSTRDEGLAINKVESHTGWSTGSRHREVLLAYCESIWERISGIKSHAKAKGWNDFHVLEKPYNFAQGITPKDIKDKTGIGLEKLSELVKRLIASA